MSSILIVDNEEKFCKVIKAALELDELSSHFVLSGEGALDWLNENKCSIVLTDLRMDGMDGLELLRRVKSLDPEIEIIIMTAFATQKTAVDALKDGAFDYLIKPFEMNELILRIKRIIRQKQILEENRELKQSPPTQVFFEKLVGRSSKMRNVYQLMSKAAKTDSTVLITGESGTGKELVAELIHFQSNRKTSPFIPINCAALPENLLESELFGYEKGAFTGAARQNSGKFESAAEGTIFLDEIGDMSLSTQAKILRVLQNREIYRLGGNRKISVKCRVIAATHRNLEEMVAGGKFRQDLFYRLNVFPIHLPPLRERKEDIPELINFFVKQNNVIGADHDAMRILMEYDWPGNVREMQNVIERAAILTESVISKSDLPELKSQSQVEKYRFKLPSEGIVLDEFERELIQQALTIADGNKTRAAELLGITRRRLYSMMDRFRIGS